MNNLTNKAKSSFGTSLVTILIFAFLLFQHETFAQTRKSPPPGKSDSVQTIKLYPPSEFKKKQAGLKRLIQWAKFRENKDYRAKDSIYNFLLELIKNEKLKINPTIIDHMKQLDSIVSDNKSNTKRLDSIIKVNISDIKKNNEEIKALLEPFNSPENKTQPVEDTSKTKFSAYIEANDVKNSQDERKVETIINSKLQKIEEVKYSTASNLAPTDTATVKGILIHFRKSLEPKIKVIGWYNSKEGDVYKRFNYNYLTAINLDNFELSATGECKNKSEIKDLLNPDGVIAYAKSNNCDIHLTIYNNNSTEIADFLRKSEAQKSFLVSLDTLIRKNNLKGININFDCEMSRDPFSRFIAKLRQNLSAINPKIQLNVTVPALINNENKAKFASYDFPKLDSLVDYYLILTDNLIPANAKYAQATSPLYDGDKFVNRSIESTLKTYIQDSIPKDKFILIVTYSGMVWNVDGFPNSQRAHLKDTLSYADIQQYYLGNQTQDTLIRKHFDAEQAAPYINAYNSKTENLEQIWYENIRSLYLKYNWALDNKIAGVSIRWLGKDDQYRNLWEAIGASLMRIDSVQVVKKDTLTGPISRLKTIIVNASKGFKLETFLQDLEWAKVVRLKYYTSDTIIGYRRFNSKNRMVGSIEDSIKNYITEKRIWKETFPCKIDTTKNDEAYQKSRSYCYSLYSRWTIYAKFFELSGILFFVLAGLIFIVSLQLKRYLLGSESLRKKIRNVRIILMITATIFLCFWLFLDPSFSGFGAGSMNGTDSIFMIYLLAAGFILGFFPTYWYFKNNRSGSKEV